MADTPVQQKQQPAAAAAAAGGGAAETAVSAAAVGLESSSAGFGSQSATEMLEFINASWSPFHAVDESRKRLLTAGFLQLPEAGEWTILPGGKYFFTRNHSTIVAFAVGKKFTAGGRFHVVGAHTDSPCPKLKPISKLSKAGFLSVGVQTYGGGLWHTWFDRDLSVAGRVILRRKETKELTSATPVKYEHRLVRVDRPILRIPTLAIHLDREVNTAGFKPNSQTHLLPVLATAIKAEVNKPLLAAAGAAAGAAEKGAAAKEEPPSSSHHSLLLQVLSAELGCRPDEIADFELSVCDVQPGTIGGALEEFVFSGRLDNLAMSFCSLKALIASVASPDSLEDETGVRVVTLFDHEECGSGSAVGAEAPILTTIFRRINAALINGALVGGGGGREGGGSIEDLVERSVRRSFVVSADMAHCLHPNYPERHEEAHQPKLHKGLVIKHNANQRYATNAVTAFLFRELARRSNLPVQDFVVRNDTGCGSTIGPILAAGLGIRTVDVGVAQLSMHSIREMCGTDDIEIAFRHFKAFFEEFSAIDDALVLDA